MEGHDQELRAKLLKEERGLHTQEGEGNEAEVQFWKIRLMQAFDF